MMRSGKGPMSEKELSLAEAAALAGVAPKTFSGYVARGQAPAPTRYVVRTPLWDEATVREWIRSRPGRGGPGLKRGKYRPRSSSSEE